MKKIGAVLGIVSLLLMVVLFIGSKTFAHFEKIVLEKEGVILDANIETAQFSKGDMLYRMWDEKEILADKTGNQKREILKENMLFFNDESLLFTDEFTIINTEGLTEKTEEHTSYSWNSGNYKAKKSTITENSIVKLANRMYFLNAKAKVYFGEDEVTTVDRPLLLIDQTGSVIVYDAPAKKRYLGHLTLIIDEKKRFDVSDEKYYVDDRVIDLTSFGGTDNKKLVVESSEKKEKNTKDSILAERKYSSESKTASNNDQATTPSSLPTTNGTRNSGASTDDGTEGNNTGNGATNEANTATNTNNSSLVTLQNYENLLEKLEELNKKSEKTIPVLTVNYINPEVTNVSFNYQLLDVSNTLVGSIKMELIKEGEEEVLDTLHGDVTYGVESFSGLAPNTAYYIRFTYQYDLGDGQGTQTLEVKSNIFETAKVEAVYQLKKVTSNTMNILASLDQQMTDLSRVRLKIISENGDEFYVDGNMNLIGNGGQEFTISGLTPSTKYHYQLELHVKSGETILLEKSNDYQTVEDTTLNDFDINIVDNNLIEVTYDWSSVEYDLKDVSLELKSTESNETIPYRIVGRNEQTLTMIPLITTNAADFTIQLNITAVNVKTNEEESFNYENDSSIDYRKNAYLSIYVKGAEMLFSENSLRTSGYTMETIPTTETSTSNEVSENKPDAPSDETSNVDSKNSEYICSLEWIAADGGNYTVVTERKEKTKEQLTLIQLEEKWQAFDSQPATSTEDGKLNMKLELSKLSVENFDFRQAIYDPKGTLIMYVYPRG